MRQLLASFRLESRAAARVAAQPSCSARDPVSLTAVKTSILALSILLTLAPLAAAADARTQQKCEQGRVKALAKYADALLQCRAKFHAQEARGNPDAAADAGACQTKAEDRHDQALERAEATALSKDGFCAGVEPARLTDEVRRMVLDLEGPVPPDVGPISGIVGPGRPDIVAGYYKMARQRVKRVFAAERAHLKRPDPARRQARLDAVDEQWDKAWTKLTERAAKRATNVCTFCNNGFLVDLDRASTRIADTAGWRIIRELRSRLIGYWPFDTDAANRAPDADPALDATLAGDAAIGPSGRVGGGALQVDGNGDYAAVTDPAGLAKLAPSGPFTVTAWFRAAGPGSDGTAGGIIVNKEGEYELARFADGSLRYAIATGANPWTWIAAGGVNAAPIGAWRFLAISFSDTHRVVVTSSYGSLSGSTGSFDAFPFGDQHPAEDEFRIGGRQNQAQWFDGHIDDVTFWDGLLTTTELFALAEGGAAGEAFVE